MGAVAAVVPSFFGSAGVVGATRGLADETEDTVEGAAGVGVGGFAGAAALAAAVVEVDEGGFAVDGAVAAEGGFGTVAKVGTAAAGAGSTGAELDAQHNRRSGSSHLRPLCP